MNPSIIIFNSTQTLGRMSDPPPKTMPASKLKVCQLCAVDFTLKKFLLPLIEGMHQRGWDVVSVCSDGPFVDEIRSSGLRIETMNIARSMNPLSAFMSLIALIRLFRREQFDVVHVHTPVAAFVGRLAAWLTRVPLVVYTAHGFYFHDDMPAFKYRFFLALERMAGWWTDLLFTQSSEDGKTAVLEKIVPADRTLVIGNGVDVTRFSPARSGAGEAVRESLGIPADAYVVGFVGRLVVEKGVVDLLRAAEMLSLSSSHIWILLIGERLSTDHATGVERQLSRYRHVIGERLISTGLRSDIPELLAAVDLFCLPSWREGLPRTILEAMAMSKPVVGTNIRGTREAVIHGETGLLVPPRSPRLLAKAIKKLVDNPSWGTKLGNTGRIRAMQLFDEGRVVEKQILRIESEFISHATNA